MKKEITMVRCDICRKKISKNSISDTYNLRYYITCDDELPHYIGSDVVEYEDICNNCMLEIKQRITELKIKFKRRRSKDKQRKDKMS